MEKERLYYMNKKALSYFQSSVDGKGLDNSYLGLAVYALKKQIPKKIFYEWNFATCPGCHKHIDDDKNKYDFCFCPKCGQAIKW